MNRNFETTSQYSGRQDSGKGHPHPSTNTLERQLLNRWPLIAAGSALGLYALTRRTKTSTAVAAIGMFALTEAGMWSKVDNGVTRGQRHKARASFAINCSPETAYNFWHDFENLPRFMQYLESVKATGGQRSEWTALGPLNTKFHWTAEITEDTPNRRIAWRSVEGSEVDTNGSVEFHAPKNGRGTLVKVKLAYVPPAGTVGKAVASILGKNPQFTVREDLRRFKALLEAGEVPTTVGQTHGPRGISGYAQQVLLREKQNMSQPQAQQPMRRAV